jgi:glycosyltransferase involved in cell wall biosynthesis
LAEVTRLDYSDFDVVVVDNAPADHRTLEVVQNAHVRYCVEPLPGLSRARNQGVSLCRSDIVAFIDDDEIPDRRWLHGLGAEFNDPLVMTVTGRILSSTRGTSTEGRAVLASRDRGTARLAVDRDTHRWFELTNFGGMGSGGNMAFRRSAFDIWPGFDVRLGRGAVISGGEEHRAFFSLVDRGYRIVYTPEAVVRHPPATSLAEVQARHLGNRAAAVAYMALLLAEEPRYRRATLKYFAEGMLGRRRSWRLRASEQSGIASRAVDLIAGTRGLLMCARAHFLKPAVVASLRSASIQSAPTVHPATSNRVLEACTGPRVTF